MRIDVRVIPNAKKEKVVPFGQGLKIYLTVPARDGRANKKLIEFLCRHYSVPQRCVVIVRGQTQRDKIVEINI